MFRTTILVSLASAFLIASASAGDDPIYIGGNANVDACQGTGEIVGLDPHGDGFLSVRSGPGGRGYVEIDRVFNGDKVNVCDRAGDWLAIIYNHQGSDCDVHRPRSVRQPYTGPCQSGWVHHRYVAIVNDDEPAPSRMPRADNCERLWRERNSIFKDAGYCFKTSRAISEFGNAGCTYDGLNDVPLSENQRRNVERISHEERALGCSVR